MQDTATIITVTVLRLSLNRVFVWGAGKFGQLGNGIRRDTPVPQDISQSSTLNKISKIVQVSR